MRKWALYSHQRSGSHWICKTICENLCERHSYLDHYSNHEIGKEVAKRVKSEPETIFFYTWRDREPCLKSIFKLRERFGLNVSSYEKFLITPYSEMWVPQKPSEPVVYSDGRSQKETYDLSYYFANVPISPFLWWQLTKDWWMKLSKESPNVMLIHYESFRENPDTWICQIAEKLDTVAPKRILIRQEKIGWMLKSEG